MSSAGSPTRRVARTSSATLLVAFLLLLIGSAGPLPALAAEPANLRDQLTDDVDALTASGEADVLGALDRLLKDTGTQLWVWYTDTTGNLSAPDFAARTAERSSFGGTDLLLVVALDDRAYGYSRPEAFPVSDADLERLLSARLEPGLRDEDYAAATVEFTDALRDELVGAAATAAASGGGGSGGGATPGGDVAPGGGGGSGLGTWVTLLLVGGIVAAAAWFFFRRRGGAPATGSAGEPKDPITTMSDDELDGEAARLLLATDDAIRDSEQELGFAQAQFGEAEAAPFGAAIEAARQDLSAAFRIRQDLDDATPEDRETRRRMLTELIGRSRQAQGRLDAETERFEQLRAFEREAPGILDGLPSAADALEARLPAAEAARTHLEDYAEESWQAIATNLEQARARITTTRAAAGEGQAALAADDRPKVVAAARVGQEAVAQATGFLDAIEHLAARLDQARDRVTTEIADAEADMTRARAGAGTVPVDPGVAGRLAEAEALLAQARIDIGHPKPDVASAYERARQANGIADEVLAGIRTAEQQRVAMAGRLDAAIRTAQATLAQASDFVSTRRGGVGGEARTRLSEAERHLSLAIAEGSSDAATGIREAEEAARLARAALELAKRDYSGWDDPWQGGSGTRGGGDTAAILIGSIIGSMLGGGGGGRRGGGFPGGGGRGGGFPGGGWGGGRGGGSGGGGRTSGGGRW